MNTAFESLKTARQIARQESVPLHRVDYAIQRLGLTEAARVGIVRLYSAEQADLICRALADIAARRTSTVFQQVEEPCPRS